MDSQTPSPVRRHDGAEVRTMLVNRGSTVSVVPIVMDVPVNRMLLNFLASFGGERGEHGRSGLRARQLTYPRGATGQTPRSVQFKQRSAAVLPLFWP